MTAILHAVVEFLTDFGDLAILLPLAALVAVWLLATGAHGTGRAWLVAVGSMLVGMGLLKLVFLSCGDQLLGSSVTSPSGHAAASACIYGSLALMVGRRATGWRRIAPALGAICLIAGIALTRLVRHDHTLPELLIGLAVGIAALRFFALMSDRLPAPERPPNPAVLLAVCLLVPLHGMRLPIESVLRRTAVSMHDDARVCAPSILRQAKQ